MGLWVVIGYWVIMQPAFFNSEQVLLFAQQKPEVAKLAHGYIMPKQLSDSEVRANVSAIIAETGAAGAKDMGKVMAALKERYAGQMDFAKASATVKELLNG